MKRLTKSERRKQIRRFDAIRDDQINVVVFHQTGQTVFDDVASGTSENVADEENPHLLMLCLTHDPVRKVCILSGSCAKVDRLALR